MLVRYQHLHSKISHDFDISGPQKFHSVPVPRIGGLAIYLTIISSGLLSLLLFKQPKGILILQLCACALPTFAVGFTEDITKKMGVKIRLIISIFSAFLCYHILNASITRLDIIGVDWLLNISIISALLTIIAITGVTNAFNIIDGFNGLASMVAIISLLAIGYVAFKVNDSLILSTSLTIAGAIAGFFIWNYPRGLIFLGDGGAYLIGFLIATLSILLVSRNSEVSPWFSLLVNAYPIFETLFSIWRRKIHQGKNPSLPDGAHFHSLIYRRVIRWATAGKSKIVRPHKNNAKTSPYLWFLSSLAVFPSVVWWESTLILQLFFGLFCISYIWMYKTIVRFKIPKLFKI